MKAFIAQAFVIFLSLQLGSCRHTETPAVSPEPVDHAIRVDPGIHDTHKLDWTAKSSYVDMKVPYAPIAALKKDIETREGVVLQSRGEAHITVIIPPEMSVLRTRLSLEQINGLIEKMSIQATRLHIQCLGRGQLKQNGQRQATYYLLVQAPGLVQVRDKLRQMFVAAGGDRQAFVAERYSAHITVGFTDRDLHATDGVIKDSKTCLYKVL
ncbi:MAG TPA: hypothetical protein VE954_41100 [Oligoflexus sp.]|uniref:hypothetical protein n=1 Tax=Oligoflexus sp. TaxID=1971216 RepID=UPI002D6ED2AA|nr:hypothetical protein [Oligoflexus sp.]HYX39540.1 hypothetical protein [Oligoflexus sp.]